jgi:hypothetical protein
VTSGLTLASSDPHLISLEVNGLGSSSTLASLAHVHVFCLLCRAPSAWGLYCPWLKGSGGRVEDRIGPAEADCSGAALGA